MIKLRNFIEKNWIVLTLIILVAITFLSLSPLKEMPPVPGTDKTHHLIAYAILMFPAALRKPRYWIFIALLFIIYSGIIELVQPYVNRYGEWLDLAANSLGIVCGIIVAEIINFFIPRKKRTKREN